MAVRAESVARRGAQRGGGEVISESMDVSCVLWVCVRRARCAGGRDVACLGSNTHNSTLDGLARRHQEQVGALHTDGPTRRETEHTARAPPFARLGPRLCTQPSRYAWPSTFSSYHEPLSQLGLGSPSSA